MGPNPIVGSICFDYAKQYKRWSVLGIPEATVQSTKGAIGLETFCADKNELIFPGGTEYG
jgi:hypothetical protein